MNIKRPMRILSLSFSILLVAIAAFASAAEAKWDLVRNGVSVSKLTLVGEMLLTEFLIEGLEIDFHCEEGHVTSTLATSEEQSKASFSMQATLLGCVWVGFEEVCYVSNDPEGKNVGELTVIANGDLEMKGGKTLTVASSNEFVEIYLDGEFCSIDDAEFPIDGSVIIDFLEAEKELVTHLLLMNGESLFLGMEPVSLHGLVAEEEFDPPIMIHAKEQSELPWSIRLKGL